MIRFLIAGAWTVLFLILSLPVILIEWLLGFMFPKAKATSSQAIVCFAFRVLLWIAGTKVTVIGEENVPKDRPVLYVPNHRSIFDIILTYPRTPLQTAYVAKKETKRVPIFSIWMAFMNCQFLDRSNLREGLKVINKCADFMKDGISVCIFPEGTRNKSEEPLLPFHDGSFKIAEKAKCPIVPVTLNNTVNIFEAHLPKIYKTHVIIEYGTPIETEGLSREELKKLPETVHEILSTNYVKNMQHIQ